MSVSTFDIFKVGIGPSGSHTAGSLIAARCVSAQAVDEHPIPYPFRSGEELFQMCKESGRTIADLMLENEKCWRSTYDIRARLLEVANAMDAPIARGSLGGELPGPILLRRHAAARHRQPSKRGGSLIDPQSMFDGSNLYAMADSPGGVAPSNGAANVIRAVLRYYRQFVPGANENGVVDLLLTAAAIGILYREDAAISGDEVEGRGEVMVACAMAAAGLAAVLGGSNEQIENAVAIGLEPCLEPDAMGAIKAINAARMALRGNDDPHASRETRDRP